MTLSLTINETLKWLSSLPILMQKSFWWWQCSTSIALDPSEVSRITLGVALDHSEVSRITLGVALDHREATGRVSFIILADTQN